MDICSAAWFGATILDANGEEWVMSSGFVQ
jgi:hypothetical protein